MDYTKLTATELARLIRNGKVKSLEVVQQYLERIRRLNPELNALVLVLEKEALKIARERDIEAEQNQFRGPLHGVPITIKEQFWLKGTKSTVNSNYFRDFTADTDAVAVNKIKQAGAVIIGKTNLAKMLMDYQVWGDIYPEGSNPHNREYTPGGSTGGGAAAVAARLSPLELGSDIGGSCRSPASFCGVYGMKPTEKTISLMGMMPETGKERGAIVNMAQIGPLARHPDDLELLWKVIRGSHSADREVPDLQWQNPGQQQLKDFTLGYIDSWPGYPVSDTQDRAMQVYLQKLKNSGVKLVKMDIPEGLHQATLDLWMGLFPYVTAADLPKVIRFFVRKDLESSLFRGWSKKLRELRRAYKMNASHYAEMTQLRSEIIDRWEKLFQQVDLILCPMSYGPAYKKTKQGKALKYEGKTLRYPEYTFPFAACFNASGHPAISIPVGLSGEKLPLGIQIVGPYRSEPLLLRFSQLQHGLAPSIDPYH